MFCKKIALTLLLLLVATTAFAGSKNSLFGAGKPTIICFGGSYCPACKKALPDFKSVQKNFASRATILYLDVERDRQMASTFPLQVIPTYFFYDKNGKPLVPSKKLAEQIEFTSVKSKDGKETWLLHMGMLTEDELVAILADMGVK